MSDVLFEQVGRVGLIRLNRPEKLNALTQSMCQQMLEQLQGWEHDDHIKAIFIDGNGERAFCAGGDIAQIYDNGVNDIQTSMCFFDLEYTLNSRLFHCAKPTIATMHGICMGGGLGVSVHARHRIVDPGVTLAMPETGIGFYPDVGASYFLSRCPGALGVFLGLTGARIGADDAYYCGLIDCQMDRDQFDEIRLFVADFKVDIASLVAASGKRFSEAPLAAHRADIDRCFDQDSIQEVFSALAKTKGEWADRVLAQLESKSPTSLAVTLNQLRSARTMNFDQCMVMEREITRFMLAQPDFYEGVRAVVVDKDNTPNWGPAVSAPERIFAVTRDGITQ